MAAKAFFMLLLAMCFQLVSGSFMYSCEDKWILMESHIMRAICRTKGQARQASELDLGFCYQNANGYLAEKYNGQYWKSCRDCYRSGESGLGCICSRKSGTTMATSIDLNHLVYNNDGVLCCFEHCGTKSDAKAPPLDGRMSDGRMEDSETTLDVGEGGASVWNNPRQLVTMGTQATFMTVTRSLSQLAI